MVEINLSTLIIMVNVNSLSLIVKELTNFSNNFILLQELEGSERLKVNG